MAEVLTAERLRALVNYDPVTGLMTRRISLSNRTKVGDVIGRVNEGDGYRYACVDGKSHAVHRLAWLYMTGEWPKFQVNHDNDVRDDNAWENLRDRPKAVHLAERFEAYHAERGPAIRLPSDGAAAREILLRFLSYDVETGLLRWIAKPSKYVNIEVGSIAGSLKPNGYVELTLDGKAYPAHRLIWVMVNGVWPSDQIDHRDTVRSNNWIANLRDVTQQVNLQNRRRAPVTSSTGVYGAHITDRPGVFKSSIKKPEGGYLYLGEFKSTEAAHQAFVAAKRVLHEGNTL